MTAIDKLAGVILLPVLLLAPASAALAQDEIDRLNMRAHAAFDAQDYDDAIKYWSEVIKLDPGDSTVWFNRGLAWQNNLEPDKALPDYTESIRLNPDDADAHDLRGGIYYSKFDDAANRGKDDPDDAARAIADFSELVRLRRDYQSYDLRAGLYTRMHNYEKAIADYTERIKLAQNETPRYTIPGYESRAALYLKLRDYDKAAADYTEIIRLTPNAATGYRERENAYFLKGDYDKAIAECNLMTENGFGANWLRARAYYQKGDWDHAIADATDLIKGAPLPYSFYSLRAAAYASKGDYDKAIADFDHLLSMQPPHGEYNIIARFYATCPKAEIRNGPKAVEYATKACDVWNWQNAGCLDTLAAAEAETGKWDNAVKHQKQAVELAKAAGEDAPVIAEYEARVHLYEQKQPYRAQILPAPRPPASW